MRISRCQTLACWHVQVYYVYGFMLLVFVILVIVTVCVTIVGTYFLLNAENYRWQWTAFSSAASTSLCALSLSISHTLSHGLAFARLLTG